MPAYEPRAVKGIASPMHEHHGADHTAGYTIAPEILSVGGKAILSVLRKGCAQPRVSGNDCLH